MRSHKNAEISMRPVVKCHAISFSALRPASDSVLVSSRLRTRSGNESGKTLRNAGESASQVHCCVCVCVCVCTLAVAAYLRKHPGGSKMQKFAREETGLFFFFLEAFINEMLLRGFISAVDLLASCSRLKKCIKPGNSLTFIACQIIWKSMTKYQIELLLVI